MTARTQISIPPQITHFLLYLGMGLSVRKRGILLPVAEVATNGRADDEEYQEDGLNETCPFVIKVVVFLNFRQDT